MSKYLSIESIKKDLAFLRENGCEHLDLREIEERMEYAVPAEKVVPLVRGGADEKYMSLSAVQKYLEHLRTDGNCCFMDFRELAHRLETEVEAADVKPVVSAQWEKITEPDEDGNVWYRCPICQHNDKQSPEIDVPYCWYCGALMKEERNVEK